MSWWLWFWAIVVSVVLALVLAVTLYLLISWQKRVEALDTILKEQGAQSGLKVSSFDGQHAHEISDGTVVGTNRFLGSVWTYIPKATDKIYEKQHLLSLQLPIFLNSTHPALVLKSLSYSLKATLTTQVVANDRGTYTYSVYFKELDQTLQAYVEKETQSLQVSVVVKVTFQKGFVFIIVPYDTHLQAFHLTTHAEIVNRGGYTPGDGKVYFQVLEWKLSNGVSALIQSQRDVIPQLAHMVRGGYTYTYWFGPIPSDPLIST